MRMLHSSDGYTTYSSLTGVVIHGKKLGRTIGFPTLNLSGHISHPLLSGTYKVRVLIDGQFFSGIGVRFADKQYCEVHCLGMTGDHRYGKNATVTFLEFIRINQQFGSVSDLQTQLTLDKQRLHDHMTIVMTFGSFDLVHTGHEHYLAYAKHMGDHLITVVASDSSIRKFKDHNPTYTQTLRIKHLATLGISDQIIAGNDVDHFAVVEKYLPDVLVFGYDQETMGVQDWYRDSGLPLPVFVQAPSHQPHIYKSSLLKDTA